jgi:hypothetical protein|tara:strand:+ start:547 stop:831 length:285 start_codon:yes stop_codon:yes gene_type:complete
MKYFNRHECMKRETLSSISKVISDLFLIDGISPFGGISNMLYGLYDGFDYSDKIRSHEEMETIKEQRMDLYEKILNICKDIDTYPKHEYDVTEH